MVWSQVIDSFMCIVSLQRTCDINIQTPEKNLAVSSEVRKMLGCLKCQYQNCIFIQERLIITEKNLTVKLHLSVFIIYNLNWVRIKKTLVWETNSLQQAQIPTELVLDFDKLDCPPWEDEVI